MGTNVLNLFGSEEFEKRKMTSQKDFEANHLNFLLWFEDSVYASHKETCSMLYPRFHPKEMNRNLPAVYMISCLNKRLIKDYQMYCRAAKPQRFKLITPNMEYLYVKKLKDNKMPSNVKTKANELILNQVAEVNDRNPNIFIGYTATKYISDITGVYAVCIDSGKIIWVTDVSLLRDNSQSGTIINISPSGTPPKLKDGIVTLKNIQKE